jgi:hypothetical protein
LIFISIGNFIYVPMEVLKMRAQNNVNSMTSYKVLLPHILSTEGYQGLYKGFWPTFWRDVPGLGLYFFTYDYLKKVFDIKPHQ